MPDQRVLSILMSLNMMLFAAGCGTQPEHAPEADGTTAQTSPAEEQSPDESPGQLIADLPSDIREVGSPDISVPKVPPKKKPENSAQPESEPRDIVVESTESGVDPSGSGVDEPMTDDEPNSEDPVAANTAETGNDGAIESPLPPPTPRPAGSMAVPPDPKTNAAAHPSAVTSKTVIQRDGVSQKHKGFSSELVYFATNREPSAAATALKDPDLFFGDEPGDLSYGVCEVSIPYKRTPGTLPEPSIWSLEFTQDPQKHVVLLEIQRLPDAEFWMALRKKVDASDLVQQTMLQAIESQSQYRGNSDGAKAGWLKSILRNVVHGWMRRYRTDRRDIALERPLDASSPSRMGLAIDDSHASPSYGLRQVEENQKVAELIESLSDEQRRAIVMRYWQDKPLEEIAKLMDKSPDAVASLLYRGMKVLRSKSV